MKNYEKTGILSTKDFILPTKKQLKKGVAILECVQRIPCNPCVDSCPVGAISMKDINSLPVVDFDKCIACGRCVGACPGLAIFVVKIKEDKGLVILPYEFLPVPSVGEQVSILDREGKNQGEGVVQKVIKNGKTIIVTVEVDKDLIMDVRNIRVKI